MSHRPPQRRQLLAGHASTVMHERVRRSSLLANRLGGAPRSRGQEAKVVPVIGRRGAWRVTTGGDAVSSRAGRSPYHARARHSVTLWGEGRDESRGALSGCGRVTPETGYGKKSHAWGLRSANRLPGSTGEIFGGKTA
jgi:hypothetical protein